MMSFKAVVKQDIQNVFLNDLEFADLHDVNGKPVKAIIDNNELTDREKKVKELGRDALYKKRILLYIAAKDLGRLPPVGSLLKVDGTDYKVEDAIDEDGIYSITMGVNRSR